MIDLRITLAIDDDFARKVVLTRGSHGLMTEIRFDNPLVQWLMSGVTIHQNSLKQWHVMQSGWCILGQGSMQK